MPVVSLEYEIIEGEVVEVQIDRFPVGQFAPQPIGGERFIKFQGCVTLPSFELAAQRSYMSFTSLIAIYTGGYSPIFWVPL